MLEMRASRIVAGKPRFTHPASRTLTGLRGGLRAQPHRLFGRSGNGTIIAVSLKLIPADIMAASRDSVQRDPLEIGFYGKRAAMGVIGAWLMSLASVIWLLSRRAVFGSSIDASMDLRRAALCG